MNYSFPYSILENYSDPIDFYAPITFLEWYKQQNLVSSNISDTFSDYKNYVLAWGQYKKKSKDDTSNILRDSYIQVLREIVVNYSTEEERRFISNADFTDPNDLDIILPFFINKLKGICLFYASAREEVKTAALQHNLRGSNLGVDNLVKKLIFDAARTNQIDFTEFSVRFPPLSAIAQGLSVYVEELYDQTDTYFNNNPLSANYNDFSTIRKELSSSNLNDINLNAFIDFKQAIIDAIRQYPLFIESLGTNNFTINKNLSGTELEYLKTRDFISYLSGGESELKLNLLKILAPKFTGTDFYYLSTGTSSTQIVSGLLFSVNNTYSSPTLNFLNKQYPTTVTVPNLEELYTEYQLGRFFLPHNIGLLVHNTPVKKYEIDTSKLKPNTVYAFPDPNIVGNVSYNSNTNGELVPLVYKLDVEWNKKSRSNQFSFGDVLSNNYNQLYYGYQSQDQDLQRQNAGFSRETDNIQFWGGEKQDIWQNNDLWLGLDSVDELSYTDRQQSLLVNDLTPVYWGSDVFGNEYGILKKIIPLKSVSAINLDDGGIFPQSNTVYLSSDNYPIKSLYDRKYTTPGLFYFRGVDTTILPASAALSAIFLRYPQNVREEMSSQALYFNMYYDTFVLETKNYVIIDSLNYDRDSGKITINNTSSFYFTKIFTNENIEKFAGEWYSERENALYLAFINLLPYLSGSNYKVVYPSIFKTSLTNIKLEPIYPVSLKGGVFSVNSYSLSAGFAEPPQINLTKIEGVSFNKSEKKALFNISYLGKNLNGMPLFVNEQLKEGDWDIYLQTFNPRMFRPYYFIYDNNYSNPTMPFLVKYAGSVGGTIGGQFLKEGVIDMGFESDPDELTFLYADGILPVQLNKPGTYLVQFDWESYLETTIFIGCSGYVVRKTGNNLIFKYGHPDAVFFDFYGEENNTIVGFSSVYNTLTSVSSVSLEPSNVAIDICSLTSTNIFTLISASNIDTTEFTIDASDYDSLVLTIVDRLTVNDVASGLGSLYFKINSITPVNSGLNTLSIYPSTNVFDSDTVDRAISANIVLFAPYSKLKTPVYCTIARPTYPDASILKFTLSTSLSNNDSIKFCETPDRIYKDLYITQTGSGSGVVFTDPYCLDCGTICFQQFPYNTTLAVIASSNVDSEFVNWIGGECDQSPFPDCLFTILDNQSLTAVFSKIPFYSVTVDSVGYLEYPNNWTPMGRLYSTDGNIDCPLSACAASYKKNTVITLSCLNPISGWFFTGWKGGQCEGIFDNNTCSFLIERDATVSATYTRYYDHILTVNSVATASQLVDYGYVYSTTPFGTRSIECSGNTSSGNPGTCIDTFSGLSLTNGYSANYGTPIALSAKTSRGYQFKKWIYEPEYEYNYITTDKDYLFINNIATNVAVSAIFDTGFYTLTIVYSGDGIGKVFNNDVGVASIAQDVNFPTKFDILSGTSFILYVSASPGNTVMALSSRDSSSGFKVSAMPIRMDDHITVIVNLSAFEIYTLTIERFGTMCGSITSRPSRINCANTGPNCSDLFVAGTNVYIVPPTSPSTCLLSTFEVGSGVDVTFFYRAGPGIRFTGTNLSEHSLGQTFSISDASLILDPTGAPYTNGPTVKVSNGEILVPMAGNRTVSAYFYSG